ncbi:MAG: EAL domain-containing protein, partial [Cyanobacteria bacterium J06639_1]
MTSRLATDPPPKGCSDCGESSELDFDFSMAFQPIVDATTGREFAQEALVRGVNGEPAGTVFQHVNDRTRYRFDQTCRIKAIQLAARLGIDCYLSINFMPNAVY